MKKILYLLFFITLSCSKEKLAPNNTPITTKTTIQKLAGSVSNNNYIFDWETTNYLPSRNTTNLLLAPWRSGSTAINVDYVSDYKKSDGWVLAYNTFTPNVYLNDPNYNYYFALYNRFRGILRFFHWIPATAMASSYIEHGLSLYGSNNSNLLNYNGSEIISPNNKVSFSMIDKQQLTLSGGSWYVFEYEIAYDPNVKNTTFPNFGISSTPKWVNISSVELDGKSTGTIEGTLGTPNTSFNLLNVLQGGAVSFTKGMLSSMFLKALTPKQSNESEFAGKINKTVDDAKSGVVNGVLNGIFGSTSSGSFQQVKLSLKTDIKLTGNITSTGSLFNTKYAIPGQINATDNFGVILDESMGIFSLTSQPVIDRRRTTYQFEYVDDQYGEVTHHQYTVHYDRLKEDSFQINWNPAVINNNQNGAHIDNLKIQLVHQHPAPANRSQPFRIMQNDHIGDDAIGQDIHYSGAVFYLENNLLTEENGRSAYALSKPGVYPFVYATQPGGEPTGGGVRITFDVVQNSSGKRTKIIKTFSARTNYL